MAAGAFTLILFVDHILWDFFNQFLVIGKIVKKINGISW